MRLKTGDIFTIPLSKQKTGFGQIVNIPDQETLIIIVFKKTFETGERPDLEEICSGEILFAGCTMDALLYHDKWIIIGNYVPNTKNIKLPYYKLGTPPDISIVDFRGKRIRKATAKEFQQLNYQTVVAPVRFELALKAHMKMSEWKECYDELYYSRVVESVNIVEKNKLDK